MLTRRGKIKWHSSARIFCSDASQAPLLPAIPSFSAYVASIRLTAAVLCPPGLLGSLARISSPFLPDGRCARKTRRCSQLGGRRCSMLPTLIGWNPRTRLIAGKLLPAYSSQSCCLIERGWGLLCSTDLLHCELTSLFRMHV